jgi:hypothetical protein
MGARSIRSLQPGDDMEKYLWKALRVGRYGGVDVVGFKKIKSGVLAGETVRCFIKNYPSEGEALDAHPGAELYDSGEPVTHVDHLPDENDPVPGGMYPDDI